MHSRTIAYILDDMIEMCMRADCDLVHHHLIEFSEAFTTSLVNK